MCASKKTTEVRGQPEGPEPRDTQKESRATWSRSRPDRSPLRLPEGAQSGLLMAGLSSSLDLDLLLGCLRRDFRRRRRPEHALLEPWLDRLGIDNQDWRPLVSRQT